MKPFRPLGFYLCLAVFSPAVSWGQDAAGRNVAQNNNEAVERWQRMTPEEKQELRERFERWKNLPPAEKEKLQKNFDNWRSLPPEEKATARRNFERWQKLTPDQRQRLQERWQAVAQVAAGTTRGVAAPAANPERFAAGEARGTQAKTPGTARTPLGRGETAIARKSARTIRGVVTARKTRSSRKTARAETERHSGGTQAISRTIAREGAARKRQGLAYERVPEPRTKSHSFFESHQLWTDARGRRARRAHRPQRLSRRTTGSGANP